MVHKGDQKAPEDPEIGSENVVKGRREVEHNSARIGPTATRLNMERVWSQYPNPVESSGEQNEKTQHTTSRAREGVRLSRDKADSPPLPEVGGQASVAALQRGEQRNLVVERHRMVELGRPWLRILEHVPHERKLILRRTRGMNGYYRHGLDGFLCGPVEGLHELLGGRWREGHHPRLL